MHECVYYNVTRAIVIIIYYGLVPLLDTPNYCDVTRRHFPGEVGICENSPCPTRSNIALESALGSVG